jgi:hypothetical protein
METMSPWTDRVSRLVLGACLSAGLVIGVRAEPAVSSCDADTRCRILQKFFRNYQSPLQRFSLSFIKAADQNGLDWRLLPAISMVESSGGKYFQRNNVFGWNSGRTRFQSIEAGIRYVASRFAQSPIYAGRGTMGILQRYNPAPKDYPPKVTHFMRELSPDPVR